MQSIHACLALAWLAAACLAAPATGPQAELTDHFLSWKGGRTVDEVSADWSLLGAGPPKARLAAGRARRAARPYAPPETLAGQRPLPKRPGAAAGDRAGEQLTVRSAHGRPAAQPE